jgi:hypothetical protein
MSEKTERKNKIGLTVNWIKDDYFTIKDLMAANSDFKEITLRVRLNKAIEKGEVVKIGDLMGGKGRPEIVMTMAPTLPAILEKAKNNEKIAIHKQDTLTPVAQINALTANTTPVVNPAKSVDSTIKA